MTVLFVADKMNVAAKNITQFGGAKNDFTDNVFDYGSDCRRIYRGYHCFPTQMELAASCNDRDSGYCYHIGHIVWTHS